MVKNGNLVFERGWTGKGTNPLENFGHPKFPLSPELRRKL